MSPDLEERLSRYGAVLDQAAAERTAGAPATSGPRRRLPGRRALAAGVAAAVAAAAMVGVVVLAGDDDGYRVRVAGEGEHGAGTLERGPDGSFPHLLIEGWRVSRADESGGPMADRAPGGGWSQVYRNPERGYDGAQVAVRTLAPGAQWGAPDGRKVDAGSGRAVFYRSNDLQATVVWNPQDDRTVVVRGVRLDDDELVEVVRGLRSRGDGRGWEATVLPEGLASVADGSDPVPERYRNAEVEFARGRSRLQLNMSEDDVFALEDLVDDRVNSAAELRGVTVLRHPAALTRYGGGDRHAAMWFADGVVYELDGDAGRTEAFLDALGQLRVVDDDTWEAALPDSSVSPRERAAEVDRMLADIPQPPGFDAEGLRRSGGVSDRYQLGARVAGAVACAWIDRWADARRAGDDSKVNEAVGAMGTSRDWRVLRDMNDEGDYPEVLWEYADAMAGGGEIEGGKRMSVEESAPDALGCPRH